MCGIVGIFNHPDANKLVMSALRLLHNRGKDACGIATPHIHHAKTIAELLSSPATSILGHTLHAIVQHLPQPLQGQGTLSANCEIYNWKELNLKYRFHAQNDAHFLLLFLDKFGIDKLNELDGVYAFLYWRDSSVYIARDLLGEKPLWYSYTTDSFAAASEKKALDVSQFPDVQELNPRQILIYNIKEKNLTTTTRPFFSYVPEHQQSFTELQEQTKLLLDQAITKRIPQKKWGLLFSGGVDSTYLAKYFKDKRHEFTCYTAALESKTPAADLIYAQNIAQQLGLNLKVRTITEEEIPAYLKKIVPLIEDSNVVKVGVALTFYLACELAQQDGCKVIFSGLGSEEIFAGYERHKQSQNTNQECCSGLLKMYERDLYRDDVLTMSLHLELRLPFLDTALVDYALKIPAHYKLQNEAGKYIFRTIAEQKGIPREFAFRKKTAAQYGSRLDSALIKLTKKHKFPSRSAYLRTFYPSHNLKLGVLFSSGKDSTSAACIMQRQNYQLSCLIHLKSKNPDSYMFQTAGTELVELQAEAMGLPLIIQETAGKKEEELHDLEMALHTAKEKYKIDGIVTGALFSTYQRDRIEKVCDKLGLKIFSPLWHKPQYQHMREVLENGFQIIFTAVAAEGLHNSWLNRIITLPDLQRLHQLHLKNGLNEAGEGGEFESLVVDCPLYSQKVVIDAFELREENKYTARMLITKAHLEKK